MPKTILPARNAVRAANQQQTRVFTSLDVDTTVGSFPMTPNRVKAAIMCAESTKTLEAIAAQVGVSVIALYQWRRRPEFQAVVKQHRDEIAKFYMEQGLSEKWQRIRILHGQLEAMIALQQARAEAGASGKARGAADPGEETGLLAPMVNPKGIRYTVTDTALVREIRETLKMISQELGQWETKSKVDVTSGGVPIRFTIPMADDGPAVLDGEWTAGGVEGVTGIGELGEGRGEK
jgi:hypothetical protein